MKNIGSIISIIIHEIEKNQVNLLPNSSGTIDLSNLAITKSTTLQFTQESASCNIKEKETPNGVLTTIIVECTQAKISPDAYLNIITKK